MLRIATYCLVVYWLAIFVGTHLPSQALPSLSSSDKVYHTVAFAGLAFLLAWAIPNHPAGRLRHLAGVAVIAIIYACIDEFTQKFIPGRTADIWDAVADIFGVVVGLITYAVLRLALQQVTWGRDLLRRLSY